MEIKAKLEERISKDGKPYFCIVVNITDNVEKIVFLDKAEIELIRLTYSNNNHKFKTSNQG